MAWLVLQGIDPGRIMLLTFGRRASDEMLRRARRALGETGSRTLGTVWGGTFHSVANRLLRTSGEAIGLDPDFTVMDQSDAEDLMDASRQDHALGSKEKRFPRKQTCFYSRCVNSSDRLDHTHERSITSSWTNIRTPTGCSPPFCIACGRSIATLPSGVTMRRASTASAPPKCVTFSPPNFPARQWSRSKPTIVPPSRSSTRP